VLHARMRVAAAVPCLPMLAPCTAPLQHAGCLYWLLITVHCWAINPSPPALCMAAAPRCRRLWNLKEAFVKATGEGLGFPLGDVEFEISGSTGGQAATCAVVALVWLTSRCQLVAKERLAGPCLLSLCRATAPARHTEHMLPSPCCPLQPLSALGASRSRAGLSTCMNWAAATGCRWHGRR
jgi:hypothetical protein